MGEAELTVEKGQVTALCIFDVADQFDLSRIEQQWAARTGASPSRGSLTATPAKAMNFDVPPVELALGAVAVPLDGQERTAEATARIYDFGVVALSLSVSAAGLGWQAFTDLGNAMDRALGSEADRGTWLALLERIQRELRDTWPRGDGTALREEYLIASVQHWVDATPTAEQLLRRVDLVPLLSGEQRRLSEPARNDLLRNRFSYYEDDLVVLTWDRAFVYEPRGDQDVADVLEVANAQLLEFRYYDELLDDELPKMYDLVEGARRTAYFMAPRRYALLARKLYTLVAEVTELTEKVDNALQVTEDVYLARVYGAAIEQLRVRSLSKAVDRKLAIIRDTYTALHDEAAGARGELLEVAIVGLIVVEILLALLGH